MKNKMILVTYSLNKDRVCVEPVYQELKKRGYPVSLVKSSMSFVPNEYEYAIVAYSEPAKQIKQKGFKGKIIYIEHGTSPIKNYTFGKHYKDYDLVLTPGNLWAYRLRELYPEHSDKFHVAGFPKLDKVTKETLPVGIKNNPPKVLFAPSWGSTIGGGFKTLSKIKGIPNLVTIPHEADYGRANGISGVIIPKDKGDISPYLIDMDIVVSDLSSVLFEAAALGKPVIQVILDKYPDSNQAGGKPLTIPPWGLEWVMGPVVKPENVARAIKEILEDDKWKASREYWANQCIYKPNGKATIRVVDAVEEFITTGKYVGPEVTKVEGFK